MNLKGEPILSIPHILTILYVTGDNIRLIGVKCFKIVTFRLTASSFNGIGVNLGFRVWNFEVSLGFKHLQE